MTTELKPCPWCKGQARIAEAIAHYVACKNCSAFGPTAENDADAIIIWNHRPEEDRLRARITDLEATQARHEPDIICHGWARITTCGAVIAGSTEEFAMYWKRDGDDVVRVKIVRDE